MGSLYLRGMQRSVACDRGRYWYFCHHSMSRHLKFGSCQAVEEQLMLAGMKTLLAGGLAVALLLCMGMVPSHALEVETDFDGASVRVLGLDAGTQEVRFMPGGQAERGWPCWWYFRVAGVKPDQPLTLKLSGSDAVVAKGAGGPLTKPLSAAWAMPLRAPGRPMARLGGKHNLARREQRGRWSINFRLAVPLPADGYWWRGGRLTPRPRQRSGCDRPAQNIGWQRRWNSVAPGKGGGCPC